MSNPSLPLVGSDTMLAVAHMARPNKLASMIVRVRNDNPLVLTSAIRHLRNFSPDAERRISQCVGMVYHVLAEQVEKGGDFLPAVRGSTCATISKEVAECGGWLKHAKGLFERWESENKNLTTVIRICGKNVGSAPEITIGTVLACRVLEIQIEINSLEALWVE